MRCPSCRVRLTRRFDRQFFGVCTSICLLLAVVTVIDPGAWQLAVGALGMIVITLLDVVTVRLVEAERQGTHHAA